ncbi:hypothetical protein G5I_13267 [Acromyrmex echinatior]|uniref:Uncharacterized protein n=1 Tax=Acromyrmex echinatior TaxID=103372 RepID=F4X4K2_ACREC|nr:hypothetical protein G5I_13267 [Acromyrmex echinatior]
MTTYLKFKGNLQAIVKLETGKVTNYFLDLVVEAATRKAQNSGIVAVDCLLDSETSLQRLTIVGGNEQNEIKTRIRRHNGKYMGRREKIEQVPLNNGEQFDRRPNPRMMYGLRSHARRDRKKANLQATIVRGIGICTATNLVRAVKTNAWITVGFRRMRKQQSSLEGNSSIEEKHFSVPWNRIHRRVLSTFSKKDDRLAYRPEITGINGEMDSTTIPNRNAFDIQVEITQTNRYCSSLT